MVAPHWQGEVRSQWIHLAVRWERFGCSCEIEIVTPTDGAAGAVRSCESWGGGPGKQSQNALLLRKVTFVFFCVGVGGGLQRRPTIMCADAIHVHSLVLEGGFANMATDVTKQLQPLQSKNLGRRTQ